MVQFIRQIKNTLPNAGILILGAPESLKTAYGSCGNRPVLLSEVQQMQQRVARDEKIMFWSWQDAMGGACSMKTGWLKAWQPKTAFTSLHKVMKPQPISLPTA